MRSADTRLMLQEQYETLFEIYNHNSADADPLGLVLLHPAEDVSTGGAIERRMEEFVEADVFKYTGMTMAEFFNSPREYCDLMIKVAKKRQKVDLAALQNMGGTKPGGKQ